MRREETGYELLPEILEAVSNEILQEMGEFSRLSEDAKSDKLETDLAKLEKKNPEIQGVIDGLAPRALEGVDTIAARKFVS